MFYRDLKTDELLLSDLSKTDDICKHKLDGSENMFLIEKAAEVVHMLGNYIVDKRGIVVKGRRSFDLLDRMASETRDTTLLVRYYLIDLMNNGTQKCIKTLKLFSIINVHFASILANKPRFITKMLDLMLQDNKVRFWKVGNDVAKYFDQAYFKQVVGILEALVAACPELVTPDDYTQIKAYEIIAWRI